MTTGVDLRPPQTQIVYVILVLVYGCTSPISIFKSLKYFLSFKKSESLRSWGKKILVLDSGDGPIQNLMGSLAWRHMPVIPVFRRSVWLCDKTLQDKWRLYLWVAGGSKGRHAAGTGGWLVLGLCRTAGGLGRPDVPGPAVLT